MEAKREALLLEASERNFMGSTLQDKLAQLDSTKPRAYRTLHAVSFAHITFVIDDYGILLSIFSLAFCFCYETNIDLVLFLLFNANLHNYFNRAFSP